MSKPSSITDYVFLSMKDGQWWTFWELQSFIKEKTGKFYGEPTISAAIRELRKSEPRKKYGLPLCGEIIFKKRIEDRRGNKYRLITGENNV